MDAPQIESQDAVVSDLVKGLDASDVVPDGDKGTEGEPTASPVDGATSSPADKEEPAAQPKADDRAEMLTLLREMRQQNALSNARATRLEKELQQLRQSRRTVKPDSSEEDPLAGLDVRERGKPEEKELERVPLEEIEQLHQELREIGNQRGDALSILAETMSFTPDYKDLKDVCSTSNLSNLVDGMADALVAERGGTHDTAALQIEAAIWKQPNPYKWMYAKIKDMQDAMKGGPAKTDEGKPAAPTDQKVKGREPTAQKSNPTIADKPGSELGNTGWTAKKLDDMPDEELIKVPSEIRQQWLAGDLK